MHFGQAAPEHHAPTEHLTEGLQRKQQRWEKHFSLTSDLWETFWHHIGISRSEDRQQKATVVKFASGGV